ncbi:MAG: MFS transporter [Actinobacteria bacterium]|nr:MFS transporter [Actinomycetota bacterium]
MRRVRQRTSPAPTLCAARFRRRASSSKRRRTVPVCVVGDASGSNTGMKRRYPKGFWTIWSTVALDMVGFGMVVPILGRYAERFGASGLEVGLLFSMFSVAQFFFAPVLGRLSDRVGRKPVIIVSLLGTAIGSFLTGAAGVLWLLFLARFIDGASGASVSVAQSAITDIAPPEDRPRLLGLLGAAFGVGFVFGPALGGLAALGGPHVPFYVASAFALCNAAAAWIRLPETNTTRAQRESTRVRRRFVVNRYTGTALLAGSAFAGFEATFALFGERRFGLTEGSAAAVFLVVGVMLVIVQGALIGPLTNSIGSMRLLSVGFVVLIGGFLVLSVADVWVVLFVALALLSLGQGVVTPSLTSVVADSVGPDKRGEALGIQQSAGALSRIVGPVVAGLMFDHVGVAWPYVTATVLTFLALILVTSSGRS